MADPTIQTFCCHLPNETDRAVHIMMEFNKNSYNGVCVASSALGIVGSVLQMFPRQRGICGYRWFSVSADRSRQLLVWLATADLLASLGVFTRSAIWLTFKSWMHPTDEFTAVVVCASLSAWIQYFYMATWLWTLCYAVDMRLVLQEREGYPMCYHLMSWVIPAALTTGGLLVLYLPDANCHNLSSIQEALMRILPNYCATYLVMGIVMIVNPIIYVKSTRYVEDLVVRRLSQFTAKERSIVDTIKLKFLCINLAYYLCWLPNIMNGFLLWTLWFDLPETVIIILWYIMAVMNPLQAVFNTLVYRKWSGSSQHISLYSEPSATDRASIYQDSMEEDPEEDIPLLKSKNYRTFGTPNESINGGTS